MKKIALNVKNMKERLVNYSGNYTDFENIWTTFQQMACMGFITNEEWKRFYDECKSWYIDEESAQVIDGNGNVIWTYNSETQYKA